MFIRKGENVVAFRESAIGQDPPGFFQFGLEHLRDMAPDLMEALQGLALHRDHDGPLLLPCPFVEAILRDPEMLEKVLKEGEESLRLLAEVFDDEPIAVPLAEQGKGQGDLPTEVSADQGGVDWSLNMPEFAVKGSPLV
jgi:hypothetical protein